MAIPRILQTRVHDALRDAVFVLTRMRSDRSFEGMWSNPDVPLLIFADHSLPGPSAAHHGGPVGSGMPVQLLFWGRWWLSADGSNRAALIETRTQQLLASRYFSMLAQYGVNPPHWRGSLVVTRPDPPAVFNSKDDVKTVRDLINALIDDDVFPDPEDERIAFLVLMPAGFTQNINMDGSHTYADNYEFPFDYDRFWFAWVRSYGDVPGENAEDTVVAMSHELVEMFTDPEMDGWYAGGDATAGEISDAAVSPGKGYQDAWVNGAHAEAYWSNAHGATVIPIDRDYRARIRGVAHQENTRVLAEGTFRADPDDTRFCNLVPACCLPDRDFTYKVNGYDEVIRLRVDTHRYRQPKCAWSIEGMPVSGSGQITVRVVAQSFSGRESLFIPSIVTIQYTATDSAIDLRQVRDHLNFDLTVSCNVTDASITGNVKVNVVATPAVRVGFSGAELVLDPEYVAARQACNQAVADLFRGVGHGGISRVPKPGDPVMIDPAILNALPAFTRVTQYRAARDAILMARMAAEVMPLEDAQAYARLLASDVPALAAMLRAYDSGELSPVDSPVSDDAPSISSMTEPSLPANSDFQ